MRPYQPNLEWAWEIQIATKGLAVVIANELDRAIQTLSDFVQARGDGGFLGGKHAIHYTESTIRVVARWRMIRPDPHWGALKLRAVDPRFHYLDTQFIKEECQECLPCESADPEPAPGGREPAEATDGPVETPEAPSDEAETPMEAPVEPESPPEGIEPEMPAAEPGSSSEDLPTAQELAGPDEAESETPPAETETPAETEPVAEPVVLHPGPEGPVGDDLDGLETVGPEPVEPPAPVAEAPAPKPKRKAKRRKKAKRKTAKRKTN